MQKKRKSRKNRKTCGAAAVKALSPLAAFGDELTVVEVLRGDDHELSYTAALRVAVPVRAGRHAAQGNRPVARDARIP